VCAAVALLLAAVVGAASLCRAGAENSPKRSGNPGEGKTPAARPYDVTRDPPTRTPQIVPVVHGKKLYLAWHTWGRDSPGDKIVVATIATDGLTGGKLTALRTVPSQGGLVGFTVDAAGVDHVLTARAEHLPNRPQGDFVTEVHRKWRKDAVVLYAGGVATDLNAPRFTPLPFYGLMNAGSGRLATGAGQLAAVFARRRYTAGDGLIHQEANALLVTRNLSAVLLKAGNTVSHSFDQRLIFDGTDFVALHQGDAYPYAALIIEKLRTKRGRFPQATRVPVYACPTFANSVYFELGGLAAEPDGYPVLFTSTRNIAAVSAGTERASHNTAWDLAMVYVRRDFDTRRQPANPYDLLTWGVLAQGYAPDEKFTVDNFTFNPKTVDFDKPDPRTIRRRVLWLTEHDRTTKATHAKFAKLRAGEYLALWEEHTFADGRWRHATTRGMAIGSSGAGGKKTITKGSAIEMKGVRLHQGDDAVVLTIEGAPYAAWVTAAGDQLLLHTLGADLKHKSYPLTLVAPPG
jgi:hypothetical protein